MRNSSGLSKGFVLLLMLALCAGPAWPASKNPEREALRKMQLLQRKAMEEKEVAEREKAELAKQLSELTAQSGGLKEDAARAKQRKAVLEKEMETLRAENSGLQENLKKTGEELAALQKKAQSDQEKAEQEQKRLESLLAGRVQAFESCEKKNVKLYEMNLDLLGRYKDKGPLDVILQHEPFTGIKDVEMESMLGEYRDKLEAQRVEPSVVTK